jgi:lysozyme family protein
MNPKVQAMIAALIDRESDQFTNNPLDKGGPTKFGITQAVYSAEGYTGSVEFCTRDIAVLIYGRRYWTRPGFDRIDALDSGLALRLFDWGVNSGPSKSSTALQRALNVLNRNASDWPDIVVDGSVGNMTVYVLQQLIAKRGADGLKVLRGMVQAQQSVNYIEIAEKNPSQEAFEFGWQLNRAFGV